MPLLIKIFNWWRDLSVSKKLYAVVGIMASLIATELFTLLFAMNILSAVRAFVGGEGLWSKAQKNAVHDLERYSVTRQEKFYQQFLEDLKVPLGDHRARIEMEKENMDMNAVKEGFIAGKIHPDDIIPMVNLMRRFNRVSYLTRSIQAWQAADTQIFEMIRLGSELHQQINFAPRPDQAKIMVILDQVFALNEKLTDLEGDFSSTLGEASRWLENILMWFLICAVFTVESTGLTLTIIFSRGLTKTLQELSLAAIKVGEGDFQQNIKVRSSDELGQLANAINVMIADLNEQVSERQQAEHASQVKNLFLANMSHEIRTPLNAILGFTDLLRDDQLSTKEKIQYLDIIERTGHNLATIINDILDLTKVEAEQMGIEKATFSISQVMDDLYVLMNMRCEEKGISLHFEKKGDVSEYICSDVIRLRQILINMIGNAIKFTEKGQVVVTYEVFGPHLLFSVKDSGSGITGQQLENLFKPFSQGDYSIKKKFGGTGLGLVLSRKLAHLLGGDVQLVESQAGAGSVFGIKVLYEPRAPIAQKSSQRKGDNTPVNLINTLGIKDKRILVVEDTKDNQLLLSLYLNKYGAVVDLAENGAEGVQKALAVKYDLVLMDMQMPVKDGYEATKELRDNGIEVPIIALTGFAMKGDREKCLKVGCSDYISKPVDKNLLINIVFKYAA